DRSRDPAAWPATLRPGRPNVTFGLKTYRTVSGGYGTVLALMPDGRLIVAYVAEYLDRPKVALAVSLYLYDHNGKCPGVVGIDLVPDCDGEPQAEQPKSSGGQP